MIHDDTKQAKLNTRADLNVSSVTYLWVRSTASENFLRKTFSLVREATVRMLIVVSTAIFPASSNAFDTFSVFKQQHSLLA